VLYRALIVASFAAIVAGVLVELARTGSGLPMWGLFALASWPLAIEPMERVGSAQGPNLIPVLVGTSALEMAFGAAFALGLWLAGVTAA
jgi:1,4-dihydroxy-2-naphthoate octaprenyltransferase